MTGSCNSSQSTLVFGVFRGSSELWILLGAISTILVLSVLWNILCCILKVDTEKGKMFLPRFRRSLSLRLRDMEDNPIYGNITYTQTRVDPPVCSSSIRKSKSHCKVQDYANLTLKAPKKASVHSSPKIEYSDVVTLQVLEETKKEAEGNTDTVSVLSDLYASVHTLHTKTLDTADGNQGYANHV